MTTRTQRTDSIGHTAQARLQQHLMRATLAGRNFSPDTTLELMKAGKVGPVSAQIAEIFQQHADLWAADVRTATAAQIDVDHDATWRACMREAEEAVGRLLAARRSAA